jgi:hypothetical protein
MDTNECNTIIPAARDAAGHTMDEILENIHHSRKDFNKNIKEKFHRKGEF